MKQIISYAFVRGFARPILWKKLKIKISSIHIQQITNRGEKNITLNVITLPIMNMKSIKNPLSLFNTSSFPDIKECISDIKNTIDITTLQITDNCIISTVIELLL